MDTPAIPNPVKALTPSSSTMSTFWRILGWILVFALISVIVYWVAFLRNISWKAIKTLIAQESAKYPDKDKVEVEYILIQGAKEIMSHPHLNLQAREFAKTHSLPIERVIVDNAIAMAQNLKFIPTLVAPTPTSNS